MSLPTRPPPRSSVKPRIHLWILVADLGPLNNAICTLSYMFGHTQLIQNPANWRTLSLSLSLRQHELHEGRGPRDETRQDRLQAPTEDCRSLRPSENSRTATSPNFDRESEREAGKGLQLEGEPEFFWITRSLGHILAGLHSIFRAQAVIARCYVGHRGVTRSVGYLREFSETLAAPAAPREVANKGKTSCCPRERDFLVEAEPTGSP